jgi:hypothetical protein
MHHPHIHRIVPVGGLSSLGKFLYYLKQLYYQNKLEFHGNQNYLLKDYKFENLLSSLYSKEWIVYCKPPFKNASYVVEYLGRYTHR